MSLSKQLTMRSLPDIGRRFGGRDHTTIMHGVRRIEELMATDSQLSDDLQLLRRFGCLIVAVRLRLGKGYRFRGFAVAIMAARWFSGGPLRRV